MPDTPDLFGPQPRRPLRGERLFFAFLLDQPDARRVGQFGQEFLDENNFRGELLPEGRRHVSMHHLGDYRRLLSWRVHAAERAGDRISMSAFEMTLDAVMSFGAMPKPGRDPRYPLVLRGKGAGLFDLHAKLAVAMEQDGMRAFPEFMPHLTLSYGEWPILARPIKPIWIPVTSFCLIHSRLGLTEYRILKRWTLNQPRRTLH
ncbi:2'-5' RNA ligase family protein [Labrys neptuniae]